MIGGAVVDRHGKRHARRSRVERRVDRHRHGDRFGCAALPIAAGRSRQRQLELHSQPRTQRTAAEPGDAGDARVRAGDAGILRRWRVVVLVADVADILHCTHAVIRDAARLVADLEGAIVVDGELDAFVLGVLVAAADQAPAAGHLRVGQSEGQVERGVPARGQRRRPPEQVDTAHVERPRRLVPAHHVRDERFLPENLKLDALPVGCGDAGDGHLARPERDRSVERLHVDVPPRLRAVDRKIDERVDDLCAFDEVGVHDDRTNDMRRG